VSVADSRCTENRIDDLRPLGIVDIDGVVADVRHRLHYLQSRPKNWEGFFAAAPSDSAHPEGLQLVTNLAVEHEIVFLTGRPERLRQQTVDWLETHGLGSHRLVMRRDGDHRPAAQVKRDLLLAVAAGRTVGVVVDDDEMVLAAFADAGYPTLAARWEQRLPEDSRALLNAQEVDGET
jgi:hypothetical protein